MAIRTAARPSAVVRPAISIIRRTRAIRAACSGVGSGASGSVMTSNELQKITVAGDEGSQRLDRVLAMRSPDLSRSRLKALILAGQVSIGANSVRDPAFQVRAGDTIT